MSMRHGTGPGFGPPNTKERIMDKAKLKTLHDDMLKACEEVARRSGYTIALHGGSVDIAHAILKFKVVEDRADGLMPEQIEYDRSRSLLMLARRGTEFEMGGKKYKTWGMRFAHRGTEVIIEDEKGKRFKVDGADKNLPIDNEQFNTLRAGAHTKPEAVAA